MCLDWESNCDCLVHKPVCWSTTARGHVKFFLYLYRVFFFLAGGGSKSGCRFDPWSSHMQDSSNGWCGSVGWASICLQTKRSPVPFPVRALTGVWGRRWSGGNFGGAPGLRERTLIQDRDPVLRPVVPAFWKSTESWWIITTPAQKVLHDPCCIIISQPCGSPFFSQGRSWETTCAVALK